MLIKDYSLSSFSPVTSGSCVVSTINAFNAFASVSSEFSLTIYDVKGIVNFTIDSEIASINCLLFWWERGGEMSSTRSMLFHVCIVFPTSNFFTKFRMIMSLFQQYCKWLQVPSKFPKEKKNKRLEIQTASKAITDKSELLCVWLNPCVLEVYYRHLQAPLAPKEPCYLFQGLTLYGMMEAKWLPV